MASNDDGFSESPDLSTVLPRVLIVSRRTLRKNKFVDFVGEYHLDLIVKYGAVPVIVPRVSGLAALLDSFEPIHGVLLCEGEDIDPSYYEANTGESYSSLSPGEMEEIRAAHSSDTSFDAAKDSIEIQLAKRCLERCIPYMGICRGSQILNVACGGTLYQDVETELSRAVGIHVKHMDYANYDDHRHPIRVVPDTPLYDWFRGSLEARGDGDQLIVNSYHHQGIRKLAPRFLPMAFAPDSLIEAFYDPSAYDPAAGKFIVGLQFHPERMRHYQDGASVASGGAGADPEQIFDYPECPRAYQEFAKAVNGYRRRLLAYEALPNSVPRLTQPAEESGSESGGTEAAARSQESVQGGSGEGNGDGGSRQTGGGRAKGEGRVRGASALAALASAAPSGPASLAKRVLGGRGAASEGAAAELAGTAGISGASVESSLMGNPSIERPRSQSPSGFGALLPHSFSDPPPPAAPLPAILERRRLALVRSFDLARQLYELERLQLRKASQEQRRRVMSEHSGRAALDALQEEQESGGGDAAGEGAAASSAQLSRSGSQKELQVGAAFLEGATPLTGLQVKRLNQMGATVRNASLAMQRVRVKRISEEGDEERNADEDMASACLNGGSVNGTVSSAVSALGMSGGPAADFVSLPDLQKLSDHQLEQLEDFHRSRADAVSQLLADRRRGKKAVR